MTVVSPDSSLRRGENARERGGKGSLGRYGEGRLRLPNSPILAVVKESFHLRYDRVYTAYWARMYSGATKKQLAYWSLTGLVRPTVQDTSGKPGKPWLYSPDDLVRLRGVVECRQSGLSLQAIRKQLRA